MELLFIYGTLLNKEIQLKVTGHYYHGIDDIIDGYKKSEIRIENHYYPLIIPSINQNTKGRVIELSQKELKQIDTYEGPEYKRVRTLLQSGKETWVYIKNN